MSEAVQSYSGISHTGRSRANGDKQAFDKYMESAHAAAEKLATTDAQRDALAAATDSLRADYLQQYRSLMNARASTYSGFVAGRGNLNSKQANSRNSALDKAMERFDSWSGDNADRVSKAVLAARTPEQVKADHDKLAASIKEKADKKAAGLKAQLLKFLSFKSGEEMPYGKSAIITKVSYDRDGYPSSLTFKMADGSPVSDDKLDLVDALKDKGETLAQAKARIRALVDEVRAENPELIKGVGAMRAAVSAKAAKLAPKAEPAAAPVTVPETAQASFLDRHNAIEGGINAGTLALDDFKSTFAELEANQDAVMAELQKLTKDQLLRAGGAMFAYRMVNEKKDAIVLAAYQKMLDTYALGRNYGPSSYFLSADSIAKNKAEKAQALRELVGNTTAEDLAARAAEIKAARDEYKAKREAQAEALANPKTLQDFRGFMSHWTEQGDTRDAAFLRLSAVPKSRWPALAIPLPVKSLRPSTPSTGMTCLWCNWLTVWSAMPMTPSTAAPSAWAAATAASGAMARYRAFSSAPVRQPRPSRSWWPVTRHRLSRWSMSAAMPLPTTRARRRWSACAPWPRPWIRAPMSS
ncbi:MAG: hypothetical protein RSE32_13530 [Comamonas sp.]|uniref:hypothetical protein n=1 Tax=Comamonas sp. TaxID=34028 RepID=UPI002FC62CC0